MSTEPVTDLSPFIRYLIKSGMPLEHELHCADCGKLLWTPCGCEYYGYTDCLHLCDDCFEVIITEVNHERSNS